MAIGPRQLLALAAGCGVAFVVVLALAYDSEGVRWLDASALSGLVALQQSGLDPILERVVRLGDPGPVGLLAFAIASLALARGRPRVALGVVVLLAATSVSSQVLKALLAHPRPNGFSGAGGVDAAAFPSGHTTAAMSLALALVMASPARLRPLAALVGAGFAIAVPMAVIVDGGHFPSDALGGYLLASGSALVVVAGLRWADARWPERSGRGAVAAVVREVAEGAAAVGLGALALGGALATVLAGAAVLGARLPEAVGYADRHTAAVIAATTVIACGVGLTALVTAALARRP
jgi:membrane-associated phospholipid phosphatase